MSDKSESFEEWFRRRTLEISKVFQRKASEFQGRPPIMVEEAWNHQQKKIDEIKKEYRFFANSFNNFFDFMQNYCSDVSYVGNTHQDNAVTVIKSLGQKLQALEKQLEQKDKAIELANEALDYYEKHYESGSTRRSFVMDERFRHCKEAASSPEKPERR